MTDNAPIALLLHDGNGALPESLREVVPAWLRANRINPDQVSAAHPITVLTVPYQPPTGEEGWLLVPVIVFHQYYVGPDGSQEKNLISGKLACFQRTVPLNVPFPDLSPPEPAADADDAAAEEPAEEAPQREEVGAR